MKKLFKMLLATLLTVVMAISFASCTITEGLSPEKVGEKLKELGYEIELTVDEEDLKEIAEAESKLEELLVAYNKDYGVYKSVNKTLPSWFYWFL